MQKADTIHRSLAKLIDFIIVGFAANFDPIFGTLAGAVYMLIGDGFFSGQSIGKKMLKLKVQVLSDTENPENEHFSACSFKDSIIRNLPFSLFILLSLIPFLGQVIFLPLGLIYCGIEIYFILNDEKGIRVGDLFAETQVVND